MEICDYTKCTGCMACLNICKQNAITIKHDNEGFECPVVDDSKCINCGLCKKVCVGNGWKNNQTQPLKIYSCWAKDDNIRCGSTSGGIFSLIAKYVIAQQGIVCGARYNDAFQVEHYFIDTIKELHQLQGSKYVQSHIGFTYRKVKKLLQLDRFILFSGTPCQVFGLKQYLGKEYKNLLTIDLVCHGVPSPLVFDEYKKYISLNYDINKILGIRLRAKKYSWLASNVEIKGVSQKGKFIIYERLNFKDPYFIGFTRNLFLRSSCHQCAFTSMSRLSDFTLADWWHYKPQKDESGDYEHKGVSLMFCNTPKSLDIFECIKENIIGRERKVEEALRTNMSLRQPYPPSPIREKFWKDFYRHGFSYTIPKYLYREQKNLAVLFRTYTKNSVIRNLIYRAIGFVIRKIS